MTTSGSVDFSSTTLDIITDALMLSGIYGATESVSAEDYALACRILNMVVKNWSGPSSPMLQSKKMWTRKRGVLFLQSNTNFYDLGPTGDKAAVVGYAKTTLTANSPALDTTLSVTDDAGFADTDNIGVVLNDGSIHWTTVSGTPAGNVVTIATAVPSLASSGNYVFGYTTANQLTRPLDILSALLRDVDDNDTVIDTMSFETYEAIGKKDSDGDPTHFYYEPQLVNGRIYFDCAPSDVTKIVKFVFRSPIQDFDATTDEPDVPQEWYMPLVTYLSQALCPAFEKAVPQSLTALTSVSTSLAQSFEVENSDLYFQPGKD